MPTHRLSDPEDPRLAPYRLIRDPELVRTSARFLAEGRQVVRLLLESPDWDVESVLVTPTAHAALEGVLARRAAALPVYVVEPACLRDVGGVRFHQGCLAAGRRPERVSVHAFVQARRDAGAVAPHLLVLDEVSNPDNVGALFRTAWAFGVDGVVLSAHAASPLYRKALRTSMGAALQLPFLHSADAGPALIAALQAEGIHCAALTPAEPAQALGAWRAECGGQSTARGLALVLGSEGQGLSAASLQGCDVRVRIAMRAGHDSLNVAAAGAIALYELTRARDARDAARRGA